MKVNQAIKYRLYPTVKQEEILWRTISNTRKMYNMMLGDYWKQLDFAKQCEERGEERPKCGVRYATYFKKENEFFCETDSMAYANAWQTVQKSLKSYFSRPEVGKPKFKSYYNDKWSYTTNNIHRNTITVENNRIRIPKVGFVKIRLHTPFPENSTFSSMTIEKTRSGHWYVTIDLAGLRGTVRSSIRKLPSPLPEYREPALSSVPSLFRRDSLPNVDSEDTQLEYDVFISHASEDKDEVVRPLAKDENEIKRILNIAVEQFNEMTIFNLEKVEETEEQKPLF